MKNKILEESKKESREILRRLWKRDFKGYSGIAIKNSTYQFMTNIFGKAGSFFFTIIIARLLMPELFGLYSLTLSTILLFMAFSDLGTGTALMKFISEAVGKGKQKKAKIYLSYLFRLRFFLIMIMAGILVVSAKFIAYNYYQKPIFLALLAGFLYFIFRDIIGFVKALYQSLNNFKVPLFLEIFFQVMRLIIVPLAIIISLKYALSNSILISVVILALTLSWALTLAFVFLFFRKKISFLNLKTEKIKKKEKRKILKFIYPLSAMTLSGIFFGYVDIVVLGRFVLAEWIGQYQAAFSVVSAIAPLVVFSVVFFPIFTRIRGERLERAFKKSLGVTIFLSAGIAFCVFMFSPLIIKIVYGDAYSFANPLLKIFSIIIILYPITSLYSTYVLSKGRSGVVAKLLILSTVLNIILDVLLVILLVNYSYLAAVIGVCVASIITKGVYMVGLIAAKRKSV